MSSFFKAIGSFFKSLWNALRKIIAIVLVIIAVIVIIWACIFCPPLGGVLFGVAFSSAAAAFAFGCVLLVGAFLVDKETAGKAVGKIGEATGDAAESVGNAAGNVLSGIASGLFSSGLVWWVVGGVAAFFLLTDAREDRDEKPRTDAREDRDGKPRRVRNRGTDGDGATVIVGTDVYQGSNISLLEA